MACIRCRMIVRDKLHQLGLLCTFVDQGVAEIAVNITDAQREEVRLSLHDAGFELVDEKSAVLFENIKSVIIEMVHYADELPDADLPEYLSGKLKHDYGELAALFLDVEGISIEKYLEAHKMLHIKELLVYHDFPLTDIARKLHYSSVVELSLDFEKQTGLNTAHFIRIKYKRPY